MSLYLLSSVERSECRANITARCDGAVSSTILRRITTLLKASPLQLHQEAMERPGGLTSCL